MDKIRSNTFISKKMSYCLRHNPQKYGLKLDEYGFVDLDKFLLAMNQMHHFKPKLTEMRIREIMHDSKKERFEIKNGKICALYGHSIPGIIKRKEAQPPDVLYSPLFKKYFRRRTFANVAAIYSFIDRY